MRNLINKCCLGQFIVGVNSCVSCFSYLYFRCGFCTSRKVRYVHLPLNRKSCSTGLQHTAGTATSRRHTMDGCAMMNVPSKTPNVITIMWPKRRRRRVCIIALFLWIIRYRSVLLSPVCNAAWHRRHKTVILYYFHNFNVSNVSKIY